MSREDIALQRFHLGAALCFGFAVFAPALAVYQRNVGDLAAGERELIVPAAAAVAAMLAALLLSVLSRYRSFSLGLILVATTSVLAAWFVFAGPVPPIDGWERPFVMDWTRAVAELAIFAVIVSSAAIIVRRHMKALFWAVCLATLLMTAVPTAQLAARANSSPLSPTNADGLSPLLTLSSELNIIHVMFDSLQTDVFEQILADNAELKAAFDGFTHYRDHAGYSNWTMLSIPALQAGRPFFDHHEPGAHIFSEIAGWLRTRSIMAQLTGQGYEVSAVQPWDLFCTDMPFYCTSIASLRDAVDERKMDTRSLIVSDLVLLRMMPTVLKPRVYKDGKLLLSRRTEFERNIFRSVLLAEALANDMNVATSRPTYKFLHFLPPHKPFVLDASCGVGSAGEDTWGNYLRQSTCTVRLFAKLLERLKHLGVYDNTIVIFQADTGLGMTDPLEGDVELASSVVEFTPRRLISYARPAFAIKGLGSRGPLVVSDRPTSHLSTLGLIAAASNGRVDLPTDIGAGPRRFVVSVIPRQESTDVVPFESFTIEGPASDFGNWRYEGLYTRHERFPGARGRERD